MIEIKFEEWFTEINNSNLEDLKNDLFIKASRYHQLRNTSYLTKETERFEIEESRSRSHNTFIDSCNILSRNMIKNGDQAKWRLELGNDRKVIGDFACYISYRIGLKAR
ncbi:MAG: hypothetical protein IAE65_12710 [Ignavibacteria bacterium]|nr:hypothetical protein [Ignavibacteria bacterium]